MFQHLYLEGNDFIAVLAGENGTDDQHTQPDAKAGTLNEGQHDLCSGRQSRKIDPAHGHVDEHLSLIHI